MRAHVLYLPPDAVITSPPVNSRRDHPAHVTRLWTWVSCPPRTFSTPSRRWWRRSATMAAATTASRRASSTSCTAGASTSSATSASSTTARRYILSPLLRLVPAMGIFSLPFCDWYPRERRAKTIMSYHANETQSFVLRRGLGVRYLPLRSCSRRSLRPPLAY
eukprot:1196232-Prorocentrum_minimum.AAC.4